MINNYFTIYFKRDPNIKNIIPIILIIIIIIWLILAQLNFNNSTFISNIYAFIVYKTNENLLQAIFIYAFVYILCVAFSIPIASYLTLIGGAVFNWLAIPLVIICATLGATIVFLLSKGILSDFFSRRIIGKFESLKIGFENNTFFYLLFLRLVPFAPFFIINILSGIMNMRTLPYIFATIIGISPGTTIYVWAGIAFGKLFLLSEIPNLSNILNQYFLPLMLLAILSLSPIIIKKLYKIYF